MTETTRATGFRGALRAAAGALVLLAGGAPLAARAAPDADCPQAGQTERLKCKFDRFADEGAKAARALAAPAFDPLLSEAQRATLAGTAARLEREKGRVTAKELRSQATKRKVKCPLRECDSEVHPACPAGDHDGVCDAAAGEVCLEIAGDGAGDEDFQCEGREPCEELCDARATVDEEENADPAAMDDLEAVYDDLARSARDVNDAIPAVAATLTAVRASDASSDPCAAGEALERFGYEWRMAARLAATIGRSAADVGERACDSTKGAFSAAFLCTGAEVAVGALEMWTAVVELGEGNVDATVMDATLACATLAKEAAGDLAERIAEAKEKLRGIEDTQAYIIRLVETAQGRRPDFPLK